ncbi:Beclin 1-associated autophagy-related key regulator [Nymphon striatum]|nr:Beclin 1-associated autophagy-related key regulator [Nymphon striatum]
MESFDVSTFCCDKKSNLHLINPMCPLCRKRSTKFYCEHCIRDGDFTRSSQNCSAKGTAYLDKFFDIKMKLIINTKKKSDINVSEKLGKLYKIEEIKYEIKEKKEKLKLMRLGIEEKRRECEKQRIEIRHLREGNEKTKYENTRVKKKRADKVTWLRRVQKQLNNLMMLNDDKLKELSAEMSTQVKSLTDFIFPIKKCGNSSRSEHSESGDHIRVNQIEDALGTCINAGNWVQVLSEDSYQIVDVQLPHNNANGDYCVFSSISKSDELPGMPSVQCVNYALMYTSQFVSILSHIFNVRLPQRLNYSEFCDDISSFQLKHKVAKLNINVMYLCLAQGMDSDIVHPVKTLENLYKLLDTEYCQYRETKDLCQEKSIVDVLEEQLISDLNSLSDGEESDSSDHCSSNVSINDISPDWEAVPQGIPSDELCNVHRPAIQERSFTGSFLSAVSAFSLWRESSQK